MKKKTPLYTTIKIQIVLDEAHILYGKLCEYQFSRYQIPYTCKSGTLKEKGVGLTIPHLPTQSCVKADGNYPNWIIFSW